MGRSVVVVQLGRVLSKWSFIPFMRSQEAVAMHYLVDVHGRYMSL